MTPATTSLAPADFATFQGGISHGVLGDMVEFHPGFSINASPVLEISGHWRSPSGRLLELDVTPRGPRDPVADWVGLHLRLTGVGDLSDAWVGFACRSAAQGQQMIRACLRSGHETGNKTGFSDVFFDRHILADPEPRNHLDALHVATTRAIPEQAPWRELVLFLPRHDFRWDLHDLRVFRL